PDTTAPWLSDLACWEKSRRKCWCRRRLLCLESVWMDDRRSRNTRPDRVVHFHLPVQRGDYWHPVAASGLDLSLLVGVRSLGAPQIMNRLPREVRASHDVRRRIS